jgi:hypothetical protein
MAFLDNSGDIILDAALTDLGRKRMAQGNAFNIMHFACADDEINYELYDFNNTNGTPYYDLQILQTPVLEAFTNNTSTMRSKLITMNRNNIQYLPILKLWQEGSYANYSSLNSYVVPVNRTTVLNLTNDGKGNLQTGILNGDRPGDIENAIAIDQGQDSILAGSPALNIEDDMRESAYMIEVDDRLLKIYASGQRGFAAKWSFRDDDHIATYTLSGSPWIQAIKAGVEVDSSIEGPRGVRLVFKLQASKGVNSSMTLFNQFGNTGTSVVANSAGNGGQLAASAYKYIDTVVRITGVYTGYRLDVPVRLVRST